MLAVTLGLFKEICLDVCIYTRDSWRHTSHSQLLIPSPPPPQGLCLILSCLSCRVVCRKWSGCGYLTLSAEKTADSTPFRKGDKLLFQSVQFPFLSIRQITKHHINICCRVRGCKVITNKVLLLRLIYYTYNSSSNNNYIMQGVLRAGCLYLK